MALRLVQLSLLLLVLATTTNGQLAADGNEHATPLHLSDRNFEHDTQAATGQTTGAWLVLFTGPSSANSKLAEDALSEVLPGLQGHALVAKVDLSESPRTAKRFSLTAPPYLKLFRDRRVFHYSGDWSASSISEFAEEGWKQVAGEAVAAEMGFTASDFVQLVRDSSQYLAVFGALLVMFVALLVASFRRNVKHSAKTK